MHPPINPTHLRMILINNTDTIQALPQTKPAPHPRRSLTGPGATMRRPAGEIHKRLPRDRTPAGGAIAPVLELVRDDKGRVAAGLDVDDAPVGEDGAGGVFALSAGDALGFVLGREGYGGVEALAHDEGGAGGPEEAVGVGAGAVGEVEAVGGAVEVAGDHGGEGRAWGGLLLDGCGGWGGEVGGDFGSVFGGGVVEGADAALVELVDVVTLKGNY